MKKIKQNTTKFRIKLTPQVTDSLAELVFNPTDTGAFCLRK